ANILGGKAEQCHRVVEQGAGKLTYTYHHASLGNNILDKWRQPLYHMGMNAEISYPETMIDAVRYFSEPGKSLAFFVKMRWPDGVVCCPRCGSTNVRFING